MGMSSSDIANKWAKNLSSSTASIQAGVQAVTQNPAQAAIAAIPRYLAGVQDAVNSGKLQRGLSRVTLQGWQQAMLTKGVPRIATGAQNAISKTQSFFDKFLPHLAGLQSKLATMPRGDLATNIQRAVTAMQHNATFQYNQ